MKHQEDHLITYDGYKLFLNTYLPDTEIKGIIAAVHGFGEHGARYQSWAEMFCNNGLAFIIYDQRGHGQNNGSRGLINNGILIKDLEAHIAKIKKEYPKVPVFLYGHSMGGNIVLRYLCAYQEKTGADLAIVTSPWLKIKKNPPLLLVRGLKKILGPDYQIKTRLNKLSHDDNFLKQIDERKLNHKIISLGLAEQIMENGKYIMKNNSNIKIPVLLMSAELERVVDLKAIDHLGTLGNPQITYFKWTGLYHELHNEREREQVFEKIIFYIERYLKKS